jgi:hypothetical protein
MMEFFIAFNFNVSRYNEAEEALPGAAVAAAAGRATAGEQQRVIKEGFLLDIEGMRK